MNILYDKKVLASMQHLFLIWWRKISEYKIYERTTVYDTEADKRRLRNIWHDNKQDIDFLKKIMYN